MIDKIKLVDHFASQHYLIQVASEHEKVLTMNVNAKERHDVLCDLLWTWTRSCTNGHNHSAAYTSQALCVSMPYLPSFRAAVDLDAENYPTNLHQLQSKKRIVVVITNENIWTIEMRNKCVHHCQSIVSGTHIFICVSTDAVHTQMINFKQCLALRT